MQLNEMKEIYATGEWICVVGFENGGFDRVNDISLKCFYFRPDKEKYYPIHKKHSEVLDHVLNGGKVQFRWYDESWMTFDNFIEDYEVDAQYEIIKDKPSPKEDK